MVRKFIIKVSDQHAKLCPPVPNMVQSAQRDGLIQLELLQEAACQPSPQYGSVVISWQNHWGVI